MLIISHKSSLDFKNFLDSNNFTWIETIDNPNLDPRIADHPDLSIFSLGGKNLVIDKNLKDYYKGLLPDYNIIAGENVSNKYPYDSIYNVYKNSNFYIHNDSTESHIEYFFKNNNYKHFFIKQGYTRCSVIPMRDKILTCDYGIYKTLKGKIEVILLEREDIDLDGFPHGFIGGTCGYFNGKLLFNGNIEKLNSFHIIKEQAEKSNISLIYPSCDLVDTGSILFV